uniref:Uncharacterized oxidoreductase YtbE-like n=1 Tax=Gadus morhua TaxID=8049 RepID=A0A8C5AML8_GADMO
RISNPQSIEMSSTSSVVLNTGVSMPLVGFGTYNLCESGEVYIAVDAALQAGYRAFDTAAVYGNEAELGRALRELLPKHGLSREEIFITSKLGPKDQGERAMEAALHSVSELGMDYIDLYLIHWPGTRDLAPPGRSNRAGSWVALEELHEQGKLRAIGVSNYTPAHMKTLLQSCKTPPALLQVRQTDELSHLRGETGVCFQAYSSLGKGELVKHPVVMEVAKGCERTPAQVLLRWAVQQGVPVLPKSSNPTRIQENMALFDFSLDAGTVERLTALDDGHKYCRDSSEVV